MADLRGKTVFVTGASRGIGLAIALRAARAGANIVVAAKTTMPNPKLPGTIYTAAEAIEAAGGKALAVEVDIRAEEQVRAAVEKAVERFGGIDILVNNASAISLTNTAETPMKRFDLMMGVNARGTFVCSQACLPHLAKASNPQILMMSPPLNMKAKWFAGHTAYTMAKYGMSMCVLGMAEEFRPLGIGVNALWPRTVIATAALRMIPGAHAERGRTPEIVADAAHWVLTQDSRATTGNFFIDDEVLARAGVHDLSGYAVTPGEPLQMDFFLDSCAEGERSYADGEG
jgi:citronellol/citronellal dehydrogenase